MKVLVPTHSFFAKLLSSATLALTVSFGVTAFDLQQDASQGAAQQCSAAQQSGDVAQTSSSTQCAGQESADATQQFTAPKHAQTSSEIADLIVKQAMYSQFDSNTQQSGVTQVMSQYAQYGDSKGKGPDLTLLPESASASAQQWGSSVQGDACTHQSAKEKGWKKLFKHGQLTQSVCAKHVQFGKDKHFRLRKNYSQGNWQQVYVDDAQMQHLDVNNTSLNDVYLSGGFNFVSFSRYGDSKATIERTTFRGSFHAVEFRSAILNRVLFDGVQMRGHHVGHKTHFDYAQINNTSFRNSDLQFVSFHGARFIDPDFSGATIHWSTDFCGATIWDNDAKLFVPVTNEQLLKRGAKLTQNRLMYRH